jgi:hypothetical protein
VERIRATCPGCGDVGLDPWRMRLFPTPDGFCDPRVLVFRCPCCDRPSSCAVDSRLAQALEQIGVRSFSDRLRSGRGHPENPPDGPPLTVEDLLRLHELLGSSRWFSALFELVGQRIGRRPIRPDT